jgi:hypothetical protein
MAPRKTRTGHQHSTRLLERPSAASDQSPIQVSTPPLRIIGSERRHKGGFRLGDR